jgi:hypothetical protein
MVGKWGFESSRSRDLRLRGKGSEGGFQQRPLSEGQQPWLVRCARSAGYDHRLAVDTRGCPRRVARVAGAGAASGEADEDAADSRAGLEAPRLGVEGGNTQLLIDQLLARARPTAAHWRRLRQTPAVTD